MEEQDRSLECIRIDKDKEMEMNIDWTSLQTTNPDIVAWLYMPNCHISLPVVHGIDNNAYLHTSFERNYDEYGTLFVDASAPVDWSGANTIIYGHSTEFGEMLTNIKYYGDEAFFDQNPYYYLLTPEANYEIDILCYVQSSCNIPFYSANFDSQREEIMQDTFTRATFISNIDYIADSNLISLSTCNLDYGFNSDQRNILVGSKKLIDKVVWKN